MGMWVSMYSDCHWSTLRGEGTSLQWGHWIDMTTLRDYLASLQCFEAVVFLFWNSFEEKCLHSMWNELFHHFNREETFEGTGQIFCVSGVRKHRDEDARFDLLVVDVHGCPICRHNQCQRLEVMRLVESVWAGAVSREEDKTSVFDFHGGIGWFDCWDVLVGTSLNQLKEAFPTDSIDCKSSDEFAESIRRMESYRRSFEGEQSNGPKSQYEKSK